MFVIETYCTVSASVSTGREICVLRVCVKIGQRGRC